MKIKVLKFFLILILISIIISIGILYYHNILFQLSPRVLFLLLSNEINIFHLHYDCHEFCPGFISVCDFELLIMELSGELN